MTLIIKNFNDLKKYVKEDIEQYKINDLEVTVAVSESIRHWLLDMDFIAFMPKKSLIISRRQILTAMVIIQKINYVNEFKAEVEALVHITLKFNNTVSLALKITLTKEAILEKDYNNKWSVSDFKYSCDRQVLDFIID